MNIWNRRLIYNFLGVKGDTIPRDKEGAFIYEGHVLELETTEAKTQRLYRLFVACPCGKRVAFCKMPQHIRGKRHERGLAKTINNISNLLKRLPKPQEGA